MTNREIAAVLFNISAILQSQRGNRYRIRAYKRAAFRLLRLRRPVAELVAAGEPIGIAKLGKSLRAKISALASSGRLDFYDELLASLPADESRLMEVPGIGPVLAARIHRDIGPTDAASLRRAAARGRLRLVWGIGPRRAAAILRTICPPAAQQTDFLAFLRAAEAQSGARRREAA